MKNKTILITGGTTGIGLATAQLLTTEGAKVIVTGRNPETLAAAQKKMPGVTVITGQVSGDERRQDDSGSASAGRVGLVSYVE
jgi:short-subunit dehydrogenase involved in D-alanine esterification of teichoic acids